LIVAPVDIEAAQSYSEDFIQVMYKHFIENADWRF